MTVSIQENLGEPEEVRQVEGQLVSSAELSARYCGFVMAGAALTAGKVLSTDQRGVPEGWGEPALAEGSSCNPQLNSRRKRERKKKLTADQWDQVLREHSS